jgi:ubiquinone biosynthesis protein
MKIANRITSGVILAALIVGATLMMGIQTSWTLFGYPARHPLLPLRGGGRRLPPLQHLHPGQAQ